MNLPFTKDDIGSEIGDTGIQIRDTFWVLDSSKIQNLMNCPRGFFLNHILGWTSTDPNIHFVFGSAWHEAMEYLLKNGPTKESAVEAHEIFCDIYNKEFASDPFSTEHYSKNPGNALLALGEYIIHHPFDPENTIYTEVSGSAPIGRGRSVHFKVDTIRKHPERHQEAGKYYVLEHKTTSRKSQKWMEKWGYKFQVGTYLHAMNSWLEDPAMLDGLTINGSIFRKNDVEHVKIPIRKNGTQMQEWLYEANYWWDYYEHQMNLLAQQSREDPVMVAFPRNTESCCKFGCNFPGICNNKPNPLQMSEPPIGYEEEFWDPRDRGGSTNYTFDPETGKITETKDGDTDE